MNRIILHADLNAFFAAVEQRDHPELRGRPVVVGRAPEQRGVVAAASYEARPFGVRSGLPMARALRLCPDAVRLDPRFERYAQVSRQVMSIYRSFTPLVEEASLDEAYLDVTDLVSDFGEAASLAARIKVKVLKVTGLTVSVGVACSKSAAKIASDKGKPDGLTLVRPGTEASFLEPLPVQALPGIGPRTSAALATIAVHTVGELARAEPGALTEMLGSRAEVFQRMARGLDERPLQLFRERKSVGVERTFPNDLPAGPRLRAELHALAVEAAKRLAKEGVRASVVALKLRYASFRTITRQATLPTPIGRRVDLEQVARGLLEETARPDDRFRLLGLRCSGLSPAGSTQ